MIVIGEEAHLAYNRVGLTSFFQHRKVENLYLNQKEWVSMTPIRCRYIPDWSGLRQMYIQTADNHAYR